MTVMRFNGRVKYKGVTYAPNTDIVVENAEVPELRARGGFIVEPAATPAPVVVEPWVEGPAAPEPTEGVTPELPTEQPEPEVEGTVEEVGEEVTTEEAAVEPVKAMVFDRNANKDALIKFAESVGLTVGNDWKKARIIEEIEKVI